MEAWCYGLGHPKVGKKHHGPQIHGPPGLFPAAPVAAMLWWDFIKCQPYLPFFVIKRTPILFQKHCGRLKTRMFPESLCLVTCKQKSLQGAVEKLVKGVDSTAICFCPSSFPLFSAWNSDGMLKEKQPSSEHEAQSHKLSLVGLKVKWSPRPWWHWKPQDQPWMVLQLLVLGEKETLVCMGFCFVQTNPVLTGTVSTSLDCCED